MRVKYLFVVMACLSVALAGSVFARASMSSVIDAYANEAVERSRLPGMEMTIIQNGVLKPATSYGTLKTDSIMPVGSISKPLTSYAVMKLIERGELRLDDKLSRHIPEIHLVYKDSRADITVRQLLNHTSGLSTAEGRRLIGFQDDSVYRHALRLGDARLIYRPGSTFEYSNANYSILGALIEKVSNQSYAQFMRQNVFIPLGMDNTSADMSVTQLANYAPGYQSWFGFNVPSTIEYNPGGAPYGYIASTAHDLGIFLMAQLNTPSKLMREAQEKSVVIERESGTYYGLGWVMREQDGRNIILHAGDNADYSAFMQLDLDKGNGVVVMANRNHYLEPAYSIDIGLGVLNIISDEKQDNIKGSGGVFRLLAVVGLLFSASMLILYASRSAYISRKRRVFDLLAALLGFAALLSPLILLRLFDTTVAVAYMNAPDITAAVLILELLLVAFVLLAVFNRYRFTKFKNKRK